MAYLPVLDALVAGVVQVSSPDVAVLCDSLFTKPLTVPLKPEGVAPVLRLALLAV